MSSDMVEQNYQPYCESCPLKQPRFETMYTSRGNMIINIECENKSLCAHLYDWLTDIMPYLITRDQADVNNRCYDNEGTARELIDEQPTVGGWISVNVTAVQ